MFKSSKIISTKEPKFCEGKCIYEGSYIVCFVYYVEIVEITMHLVLLLVLLESP